MSRGDVITATVVGTILEEEVVLSLAEVCRASRLSAERVIEMAEEGIVVDYTKPLHELTAVERDLIEMEARYKGAWLLTLRAVSLMAHGESNRLESSMCKFRAGEAVTWITQKAVELLGPAGYSREFLVEKWMRDAKINDIYEGTRQINQLIVEKALEGKTVVRLKGGDPFIFGRGGEEAEALTANDIPYEIVPGVVLSFIAAVLFSLMDKPPATQIRETFEAVRARVASA